MGKLEALLILYQLHITNLTKRVKQSDGVANVFLVSMQKCCATLLKSHFGVAVLHCKQLLLNKNSNLTKDLKI